MKSLRHEAILKIIAEREIDTQEGIQSCLKELGYDVTQATVSRDIKSLDLVKVMTADGRYRYSQKISEQSRREVVKYRAIFVEAVLRVDSAQNIVAVKCHTGMGNAACAAMDMMELPGVVGTLAGDDTVFILMRDEALAKSLEHRIGEMLSQNGEGAKGIAEGTVY